MNQSVKVPAHILQDLIFNAGLMAAGQPQDEVVTEQCDALQACITQQVGDCDAVYGRKPGTSPSEISFIEQPMAEIINFPTRTGR